MKRPAPALRRGYTYAPRSARGLEMAGTNNATHVIDKTWEVKSADGQRSYLVHLDPLGCTCPDWRYRGEGTRACKHIIAAALMAVGC